MTNPLFPNRPDHPDYELLSQVLQGLDAASEGGQPFEDMLPVDRATVVYAAEQRALRATMMLGIPAPFRPAVAAMWIDAFAAGYHFHRRRP